MATQAAYAAEKAIGHEDNAITAQDVSGFPDGGTTDCMKALIWTGKNKVQMGEAISRRMMKFG